MRLINERPGSLLLMSDDAPSRALASLPEAELLPEDPDPADMPQLPEDPFGPSFVLFDDPLNRDGDVQWEIGIRRGDEIVALAALSESLSGPDLQFYSLTLDSIFVHPEHRGGGIGKAVVSLMGELFRDRVTTIGSVDPDRSWMSCEPASDGGEALANLMFAVRKRVLGDLSAETPAP